MKLLFGHLLCVYRSWVDWTVSMLLWRWPDVPSASAETDVPQSVLEKGLADLPRASSASSSIVVGEERPVPYRCIHHAILAHAARDPSAIAVTAHTGETITYGELAETSLRVAQTLRAHGVGKGSRVCLVIQRSIPPIVAILAVLRLGAAYIPLDGDSITDQSLQAVIHDAQPTCTLLSRACVHRAAQINGVHCFLEDILDAHEQPTSSQGITDIADPSDCAYIIFTSGTTGVPKGVKVSHRNVTNLLCLSPGNLGIAPGVHVAQLLNVAFDMCVWETLGCLMNGGTLHLRGPRRADWLQVLRTVHVVISTPSILAQHDPADYPNIRVVATAGEPCPVALADRWARQATFYNSCGPTEVTIVNTMHRHSPGSPLTVGAPTPNNAVYVLDDDLRPVPRGAVGLMWAGGLCVSQGYLNRADLTASKFKPDPFGTPGSLMYNTGDIGRLRDDGELDHLGRIDDQVKIQGFRLELDGVSAAMRTCPGVDAACALLVDGELWGFFSPGDVSPGDVRAATARMQPKYAVPTKLKALDTIPLTCNGKVNKVALRSMAVLSHLAAE
ncbi:AMP-binding protein [Rhodofomes roseus]|uniref:AMP-binding protein n=1 Tax=Rhodofomes roseus TaxID=34475 RepID=A0ABQ8KQW7_9APHY|nr:AMP-binding protein [Rhodofomes roseus]KAH9840976.1 AMP-binding protein [Rhodofomes roseus]